MSGTCWNQPGIGDLHRLILILWYLCVGKTRGPQSKRQMPSPQGYCSFSQLPTDAVHYAAWGELKVAAAVELVFGSANMRGKGKGVAMLLRTLKKWACVYTIFGCKTPLLSSATPLSLLTKAVGEMLCCWSRIVPWDQSEKVALKGVLQHSDSWAAHGYCRAPFLCSAGWPAAASGLLFPKWGYTYTSVSVQVLSQGRNCIWRRWSIFLALLSQLGSDGLHISSAPDTSCGL